MRRYIYKFEKITLQHPVYSQIDYSSDGFYDLESRRHVYKIIENSLFHRIHVY